MLFNNTNINKIYTDCSETNKPFRANRTQLSRDSQIRTI